jgi:tetratricopeptide (TPR) repeat protein
MRALTSTLTLVLTLTLLPAAASAQSEIDPDAEIARGYFLRGVHKYDQRDYQGALKEFQAARAAKPLPAFDYNIARCLENLGRTEEAITAYERFAAATPNDPDAEEARQRVTLLLQQLSTPPAPPPAATPSSSAPPSRRPIPLWAPAALGGAALALLGVGLGLYLSAHLRFGELQSSCSPGCNPSEWSGLDVREQAGIGLIAVGGIAAAADAVLWGLAFRHPRAERSAHLDGVDVAAATGGATLLLRGRF